MKLPASKAQLWLVMLIIAVASVAAAQSSPLAESPAFRAPGERVLLPVLATGKSAASATAFDARTASFLPDAPSAVAARESWQSAAPEQETQKPPKSAARGSLGLTFLAANGMLLGSTIANVEMIARCRPSSCQAVPDAIRSRPALYGIGIPSSLAISYISYRMKRAGTRWWIVPVAVFTAGNVVYAVHASQWSR